MKKKGFTLIEIIVSVMVLSLVLTGLAGIIISGKRWVLHSSARTAGTELGAAFLEPLMQGVREDLWGSTCVSTADQTGCDTSTQNINGIPYTPSYDKSNVTGTDLRRVKITLVWTEPAPAP